MNSIDTISHDFFTSVTLKKMDRVKLMNRTDTKFIFNKDRLNNVLRKAADKYMILEINGLRSMDYRTIYFDTPDFKMYNAHQNGKLNRYKIRHRKYEVSNISFLEVKFKSNKGRTIKKRIKRPDFEVSFSDESAQFIEKHTPFKVSEIQPTIENRFTRITLMHKTDNERVTIDLNLSYHNGKSDFELPALVIAEVKQEGFSNASTFIRILKSERIYPSGMSKYCIGSLLLNKELKHNNLKRKLLTLNKTCHDKTYFA